MSSNKLEKLLHLVGDLFEFELQMSRFSVTPLPQPPARKQISKLFL
jgi:hypothetical protein